MSESSPILFRGRLSVFVSGFTMLMVQVVFLREFSSLYFANELIVGVFLSFWMLFTGTGAFVVRFFKIFRWNYAGIFPLLSGVTALLALWLLYAAKEWLVPGGTIAGLSDWLLTVALVTFIFCFPSGMIFTWFSAVLSNFSGSRQTGSVYIAEQAGSLMAGVLFYMVSSFWFNAFTTLTFLLGVNYFMALYLFMPIRCRISRGLALIGLFLLFALWFVPQYRIAREMVTKKSLSGTFFSPYGSIDILDNKGGPDFFEKGHFVSGELQSQEREELIHPALLLHDSPRHILLINVDPGLIPEALKYDSLEVDFVSSDMARIHMEQSIVEYLGKADDRVEFIHDDPIRFLKSQPALVYDVVLIGGSIPYNLEATRFYTSVFFELVSGKLKSDGLMVTGGMAYIPACSENRRDILRVLGQTISKVFPYMEIWVGKKVFFIASKKRLEANWWQKHPKVIRENKFVREEYLPDSVLKEQGAYIKDLLRGKVAENTLIHPVLFQLALHDMSEFWDVDFYWFVVVLGLIFVFGLLFFRESAKGVFLAGFVLGGMQVDLLLMWQLVMGDLYKATGLLFSLFMAGLAIGAWLGRQNILFFKPRFFPVLLIVLSVLAISSMPVLDTIGSIWLFPVIALMLILSFSIVGGGVFVSGLSLHHGSIERTASFIYVADVVGGALGSFLAAIFFVPFTGLVNTGYLFGMAVLVGGLLMIRKL
jgi:spermidine synthase